jgi:hypothetical protein
VKYYFDISKNYEEYVKDGFVQYRNRLFVFISADSAYELALVYPVQLHPDIVVIGRGQIQRGVILLVFFLDDLYP